MTDSATTEPPRVPAASFGAAFPPVRPGYVRVVWIADLPADEFDNPREVAEHARFLAAGLDDPLANVFTVVDGATGIVVEVDLAP